ncbi:hypothetical protein DICPUDRAFT_76105 [Dictyostelium purpureum]|uniref:Uncharacterized protein n=1 Tax=Dictyostelium purpureum TaxID=5786 RepID=F0ZCL8_DICPU|nr:uncharacterized protein DICPUDRAFT_76105 [Dictyostelium purpureum]EGC38292.1 hypothetical protein DICPUDRAFT_76105 [Dictyostelium purpureum]|eukprot:XP_003285153.1 hypothetical protein DICPUDRAFT_76105 [Dictyostelium purpureum]
MTLFPNYIYSSIITSISAYLYTNDSIPFDGNSKICYYNNEVIGYSLVSKTWFQITSKVLPNFINQNNKYLNHLIQQHQGQQYKIIKLSDSIKYFNYNDYLNHISQPASNNNNINLNDYRKIIINTENYNNSNKLLQSIKSFPNNISFTIPVSPSSYLTLSQKLDSEDFEKIQDIDIITTNLTELYKVLKTDIKEVRCFQAANQRSFFIIAIEFFIDSSVAQRSTILDLLFAKEMKHDSVQSIYSGSPSYKFGSKLENLYVYYSVEDIFGKIMDEGLTPEEAERKWYSIMNEFSNDRTIKYLEIKHFCSGECVCHINNIKVETIVKGFQSLLSNPANSSIEALNLVSNNQYDEYFFQGLAKNKSIRDLSVHYVNMDNIITKVLPYNRAIRNFKINSGGSFDNTIKSFNTIRSQYPDQIDLYSITVSVSGHTESIDYFLDYLKENSLPVRDVFILLDSYGFDDEDSISGNIFSYKFKTKNTFINVISNSKLKNKIN